MLVPTSVLLLRRLAHELELQPAGFDLLVEDTARALGVGTKGGRSSPFARTVQRLCQFGLAHLDEPGDVLLARRKSPPAQPRPDRPPPRRAAAAAPVMAGG